jgi:hypothetical protein
MSISLSTPINGLSQQQSPVVITSESILDVNGDSSLILSTNGGEDANGGYSDDEV